AAAPGRPNLAFRGNADQPERHEGDGTTAVATGASSMSLTGFLVVRAGATTTASNHKLVNQTAGHGRAARRKTTRSSTGTTGATKATRAPAMPVRPFAFVRTALAGARAAAGAARHAVDATRAAQTAGAVEID